MLAAVGVGNIQKPNLVHDDRKALDSSAVKAFSEYNDTAAVDCDVQTKCTDLWSSPGINSLG